MAQPDFSIATHRVVRIDGGPLDYPARHIVIPDGIRAMPSARATHASHRTALRRFGHAVSVAIAMSADFIADPRFLVGGYIGVMLTLASAVVWAWVQS